MSDKTMQIVALLHEIQDAAKRRETKNGGTIMCGEIAGKILKLMEVSEEAPPAKSEVSEAELRAFAKQVADNDRDQYHMSEGYAACIIAGPLRDFLEKRSSPGAQSGGSV